MYIKDKKIIISAAITGATSQIGKPQLLNDIRRFLQIIYKITVTLSKRLQTDRDIILREYFRRDRQKLRDFAKLLRQQDRLSLPVLGLNGYCPKQIQIVVQLPSQLFIFFAACIFVIEQLFMRVFRHVLCNFSRYCDDAVCSLLTGQDMEAAVQAGFDYVELMGKYLVSLQERDFAMLLRQQDRLLPIGNLSGQIPGHRRTDPNILNPQPVCPYRTCLRVFSGPARVKIPADHLDLFRTISV